jgi:hypothetical protein
LFVIVIDGTESRKDKTWTRDLRARCELYCDFPLILCSRGCLYENGCENNFDAFLDAAGSKVQFIAKEIALQIMASSLQDPVERAIHTLLEYRSFYKLSEEDIKQFKIQHIHSSELGPKVVIFKQEIDGLEVHKERISVVLSSDDLRPVALSGSLPTKEGYQNNFKLNILEILKIVVQDSIGKIPSLKTIKISELNNYTFAALPTFSEICQPIRFKKVLYNIGSQLISSYYLEIYLTVDSSCHLFNYVISAETGAILTRQSMTHFATFNYRVFASTSGPHCPTDGPQADFTPHPTGTPDGSVPAYISPTLISVNNGPISTGDSWLPNSATETTGNNVECYVDILAPDGYNSGDIRPSATSPGTFDRTYDISMSPSSNSNQRMASGTQAFYTINWLHDFFYDAGFDEKFNAQTDNYGRGGLGSDAILAETQDYHGDGYKFAQISTPADGYSPRLELNVLNGKETVSITSTPSHSYSNILYASFGPASFELTADVILADDGTAPTSNACEPLINTVAGKIVLIDLSTCTGAAAARRAQDYGAVGAILITSNITGTDAVITIPVIGVDASDGAFLKSSLMSGPVTATLLRATGLQYDTSLDNTIIAHEWGHYLTARLAYLENNQGRSLAEGYSDFVALLMILNNGDDLDATFAIGIYVAMQKSDNAGYYGVRRFPYSTNMNKNGLTFKHIADSSTLPSTPISMDFASNKNSDVQNAGEVWATMLWECYIGLVKDNSRLSFTEAQTRMLNYLVASLKVLPGNPTFTEARDSLLAVAAANDVDDATIFYTAFAKRGLGTQAVSPYRSSLSNSGLTESFNNIATLTVSSLSMTDNVTSCDNDGILDQFETGYVVITIKNSHMALPIMSINVTVSTSFTTFALNFTDGNSVLVPVVPPGSQITVLIKLSLPASSGPHLVPISVSLDNGDFSFGTTLGSYVNYDSIASTLDSVEIDRTAWTTTAQYTFSYSSPTLETVQVSYASNYTNSAQLDAWFRTYYQEDYLWYGSVSEVPGDSMLISPLLSISSVENLVISFDHSYNFESGDGAVIELFDGSNFYDITNETSITLQTMTASSNVLYNREVITGSSNGFPTLVHESIDVGNAYAGRSVKLRFRIGSDNNVVNGDWFLDNIKVTGITNTPFTSISNNTCVFGTTITTSTTSTTSSSSSSSSSSRKI